MAEMSRFSCAPAFVRIGDNLGLAHLRSINPDFWGAGQIARSSVKEAINDLENYRECVPDFIYDYAISEMRDAMNVSGDKPGMFAGHVVNAFMVLSAKSKMMPYFNR